MATYASVVHEVAEEALKSLEPMWELRGVVRALLADGHDRDALTRELLALQLDLRAAGREQDEDVVGDVLDCLAGWCAPELKL